MVLQENRSTCSDGIVVNRRGGVSGSSAYSGPEMVCVYIAEMLEENVRQCGIVLKFIFRKFNYLKDI